MIAFLRIMHQAVVPATGLPSASVQSKAAPPQAWTSIPRCCLYHACSAGASLALKKMPPMPVTRFMEPPRSGGGEGECLACRLTGYRVAAVVSAPDSSLRFRLSTPADTSVKMSPTGNGSRKVQATLTSGFR